MPFLFCSATRDDLALALVQPGQSVERLVDTDEVQPQVVEVVHYRDYRVEQDPPLTPAAPGRGPPPGVLDENLPHVPRRDGGGQPRAEAFPPPSRRRSTRIVTDRTPL